MTPLDLPAGASLRIEAVGTLAALFILPAGALPGPLKKGEIGAQITVEADAPMDEPGWALIGEMVAAEAVVVCVFFGGLRAAFEFRAQLLTPSLVTVA